ncbi:uncharacterized protein FIESC28_04922 [Fusarium coffeatum]|uniref:Uncharacterized protein n=1 Tax=Fusarium coffeatum TaxID=231269 RepID=A0A366RYE4_9HYPO|nr:uncharacterized protein FIESC28_04922 [Fusarium coffeatum]RBR21385.1 hypothetical protein FIESC28_04922 [Fusarium coffeatum]
MSEGLDPLSATFELRFKKAWRLWRAGANDTAETMAKELLLEPRLGRFHKAGMHTLLSTSSNNYVEHGLEAVRLYTEISDRNDLTEDERKDITVYLDDANKLLDKARQDQAKIDHQIQEKLAGGMTMEELHDAQIEEMNRRLDAEEAGISEHGPDSQSSVPEMTEESHLSSQPAVPLRPESHRTDNDNIEHTVDTFLGMDLDFDDNSPLPDIVRHKPGSGTKKDEDKV